jgi:hypothetical protein
MSLNVHGGYNNYNFQEGMECFSIGHLDFVLSKMVKNLVGQKE